MRAVVLGATGEMGRRVARRLAEQAPEVEPVLASHRGAESTARADVCDADTLAPLLAGARVVVNAVGPYRWDPDVLVGACVAARCHYVDLAEDPDFLAAVARAAERHGAASAGVAVVCGASTVPGLVALLAGAVAGPDTVAIAARLSMGSANPVSRGLLVGLLRPLGRARPDAGHWFRPVSSHEVAGRRLRFAPYPFPTPGLGVGGRRLPVAFHVGFDRAWITHALSLAGRVLGRLPEERVESLAPVLLPLVSAARPLGTPLGVLTVEALDAAGRPGRRATVLAHAHGLDVPALPAVWAARALLRSDAAPPGPLGLDALLSPAQAVEGLEAAGYEVRLEDAPAG